VEYMSPSEMDRSEAKRCLSQGNPPEYVVVGVGRKPELVPRPLSRVVRYA
jgi:hypothetical protein